MAEAHSVSSKTSTQRRILAFGDSLTAGTSSGFEEYPYAPVLEKKLLETRDNVVVRYRGMPGWTTVNMLDNQNDLRTGLVSAIKAVRDPSLSLVIILAGTNDMGYGFSEKQITDNLIQLHTLCHENGVPKTLAIGIPPSGYQAQVTAAAELAASINNNLQKYANENSNKVTYTPFPFDYGWGDDKWANDGLHFTKKGYEVIGSSLAPTVGQILDSLENNESSSCAS